MVERNIPLPRNGSAPPADARFTEYVTVSLHAAAPPPWSGRPKRRSPWWRVGMRDWVWATAVTLVAIGVLLAVSFLLERSLR